MPNQSVWRTALARKAAPGICAEAVAMERRQGESRLEVPSSRRDILVRIHPALKGGVTANTAFQAGSVFQR